MHKFDALDALNHVHTYLPIRPAATGQE